MVVVSGAMWNGVMMGAGMGRQRGARGRGGTTGPTGDLPHIGRPATRHTTHT